MNATLEVAKQYLEKREGLDNLRTFQERKRAVMRFIMFLVAQEIAISDISKDIITEFFSYMIHNHQEWTKEGKSKVVEALAVNSAHQQLALVKSFVRWAFEQGEGPNVLLIFTTTLRSELPKKSKRLPTPPTQEQMQKIMVAGDPTTKTIIRLLYETGMRISDLLELKVSGFNPKTRTLRIFQVKQQTERIAQLTEEGATILAAYIRQYRPEAEPEFEDVLFTSPANGKHLTARTIERWVKKVSTWAGTPITPHKIRAACATHMLENGADIRQVQTIGGWQSLSTLEHYAAVSRTEQKRVWNSTHPLAKQETEVKKAAQQVILEDNAEILEQMQKVMEQLVKISS